MSRFLVPVLLLALTTAGHAAIECPDGDIDKCDPLKDCKITVLKDQKTGWMDDCEGLTEAVGNHTEAECKDTCYKDVNCSVWQFSNYLNGVYVPGMEYCYTGIPTKDCETRTVPVGFKTLAGQRIQRGKIEVTGSAMNIEVMGLKKFEMKIGTEGGATQIERCKQHCYSDTFCGVWQYEEFKGALSCWVEKNTPRTGVQGNNTFSKRVLAGEYIKHYCPTPTPDSTCWPCIIAGIAAALCCLGLIGYLCMKKTPKKKTTRAVSTKPKHEEPEEEEDTPHMVFIPQPSVLIPQQQSVQYTQVQQAVPVQTTAVQQVRPVQTTAVQQVPVQTTAVERVAVQQAMPVQTTAVQTTAVQQAMPAAQYTSVPTAGYTSGYPTAGYPTAGYPTAGYPTSGYGVSQPLLG